MAEHGRIQNDEIKNKKNKNVRNALRIIITRGGYSKESLGFAFKYDGVMWR